MCNDRQRTWNKSIQVDTTYIYVEVANHTTTYALQKAGWGTSLILVISATVTMIMEWKMRGLRDSEAIDFNKPGNKVAVSKNGRARLRFEWMDHAKTRCGHCVSRHSSTQHVIIDHYRTNCKVHSEWSAIWTSLGSQENWNLIFIVEFASTRIRHTECEHVNFMVCSPQGILFSVG
eukprot:2608237-Amphidinium_carterae.1